MAERVPNALREYVLPLDWDVRRVWALDAPVERVPIERFQHLLDLPLWSSVPDAGMLFDLRPRAVLDDPACSPWQARRIASVDLTHPLDFALIDGRAWILDGVHRIARATQLGRTTLRARFHAESALRSVWS